MQLLFWDFRFNSQEKSSTEEEEKLNNLPKMININI
jgi:hypothetical protein